MFLGFQWMQDNKFLFPDCLGIICLIIKYCKAIDSGKAKYLLFCMETAGDERRKWGLSY